MIKLSYRIKLIVAIVLSLLIGGVLTFFILNAQPKVKQEKAAANLTLSKTISSITVSGEVSSIEEKKITVTSQGDSITFLIGDNSPIYTTESKKGIQEKVTFEYMQIGDVINTSLKMGDRGELTAMSVMIFGKEQ